MSFLRPQAEATLRRWREVIFCAVLAALGFWITTTTGLIARGFGWVLVAIALAALIPAFRRMRFAGAGDGPGVVSVDEGRVEYMGPYYGGAVDLSDLDRLSIRRTEAGAAWVLTGAGSVLVIPIDARGADALFDAFTQLPGLDPGRLLQARKAGTVGTRSLWQRMAQSDVPRLTP